MIQTIVVPGMHVAASVAGRWIITILSMVVIIVAMFYMSKPNLTPLEADEAHVAMQYMQARGIKFTHVKNETGMADERGKIRNFRALMDYQDGVSPGFPDFVIVLPGVGLLCPELKRQAGNEATTAQQSWIEALNTIPGVEARVCKGAAKLIEFIEEFYPLRKHA